MFSIATNAIFPPMLSSGSWKPVSFEDVFGRKAGAHRAGRWGGSERTAILLEELGVGVDLSPLAGYEDGKSGHPNFRNLSGAPFWRGEAQQALVCCFYSDLSAGPGLDIQRAVCQIQPKSGLAGLLEGLGKPVRFSPDGLSIASLKSMARQLAARRLPVAVFSVHSTSFYAGGNPYAPDEGQAISLRARSAEVLRYCIQDLGMQPATCAEVLHLASGLAVLP